MTKKDRIVMGKTERHIGNEFTELIMPPFSTCALCRQRMNEVCLEKCAPAKDYSHFELRQINLEDMPALSPEEVNGMPPKVARIVLTVYVVKIVSALQGKEEYVRPRFANRPRGVKLPHPLPLDGLLDGAAERNSTHQAVGAEDSDTAG